MSTTLQAESRARLGTRDARKLRTDGRIPCNIQGEGRGDVNVHVGEREFLTARRHHEHLFDIEIEGVEEPETAIVRDLQWNLMGERIVHVEFKRVVRGRETEAEVELSFSGHPKGGILNHLVTHLTIAALPSNLPDEIEVRVDDLEEGHVINAGELELPEGVRLVTDPDTQVCGTTVARGLEEEVAEDVVGEVPGFEEGGAPEETPDADAGGGESD